MLQGDKSDGEAGDVFENRLLGGQINLLYVSNRSCIDGEVMAVFYPSNGALADVACMFKPSFFTDFLREPRKPVCDEDYSELPPGSYSLYPAVVSGSAQAWDSAARLPIHPARQADPITPTKNGCRLRSGFPSGGYKWGAGLYRTPHRRNCIPRRVPPLQLAQSK